MAFVREPVKRALKKGKWGQQKWGTPITWHLYPFTKNGGGKSRRKTKGRQKNQRKKRTTREQSGEGGCEKRRQKGQNSEEGIKKEKRDFKTVKNTTRSVKMQKTGGGVMEPKHQRVRKSRHERRVGGSWGKEKIPEIIAKNQATPGGSTIKEKLGAQYGKGEVEGWEKDQEGKAQYWRKSIWGKR